MVIHIDADLERVIDIQARAKGVTAEQLALGVLRDQFPVADELVPQDEWERKLLEIGTDCGVSLDDKAVSSEGIYD